MEFDPFDNILVGWVLDIDDVICFHGEVVAEITRAFHESVDDYVAAGEKLGQSPDKPASGRLMLRVDPAIHAAAAKAGAHAGQSLSKWAEQVLKQAAHARTAHPETPPRIAFATASARLFTSSFS